MKNKIKGLCVCTVLAAITLSATAFAADETQDYSFKKAKTEHFGQGGEQTFDYSHNRHTDTEKLVEAGIINQETADKISEYMSEKHEQIKAMYNDMENVSPEERHNTFAKRKHSIGNTLEELVDSGIITEEELNAIEAYKDSEQM